MSWCRVIKAPSHEPMRCDLGNWRELWGTDCVISLTLCICTIGTTSESTSPKVLKKFLHFKSKYIK